MGNIKRSMKFESFSEILFKKKKWDNFPFKKISIKQPFNPWTLQTSYFRQNVYIFQTTFVTTVKCFFFDFWSIMIPNKFCMYFIYLSNCRVWLNCYWRKMFNFRNCNCFEDCDFPFNFSSFRFSSFYFLYMIFEIPLIFKFFVVRIMKSENFQGFFKISIFHSTEWHLYPFLYTNTGYFTLIFIRLF